MSVNGSKLLFEGFLQKRKDTLKLRWVTYWFRLQNTTLFFYTKKNGSASHLRGYYYIYTVQAVREMQRVDSKRFMFEIIMTNGKRKVLAAETAGLRKEWVGYLWQAMHLSSSGLSGLRNTSLQVSEQWDSANSSAPICSDADSVTETLPLRPVSVPGPPSLFQPETSIDSSTCTSEQPEYEEPTYQNIELTCNSQQCNDPQRSSGVNDVEDRQEGDYDVLPSRKNVCETKPSTEMDEGVYDFPISYRVAADAREPTESIYDVPSALLRMSDVTTDEQPEEGVYWRI